MPPKRKPDSFDSDMSSSNVSYYFIKRLSNHKLLSQQEFNQCNKPTKMSIKGPCLLEDRLMLKQLLMLKTFSKVTIIYNLSCYRHTR